MSKDKHYKIIIDVYQTEDDYEIFRIVDPVRLEPVELLDNGGWFMYSDGVDDWIEDQEEQGYTFDIVENYRSEY